ncbi:RHO1 GDP-GTP exchange protein 2 [Entomophthora muscae]|uniref:RHO1 GDP-GTP exchange protein 2 n=1 Tax=Entomophthora muscae TaxID=34485 RepID=A0ACC2UFL6_9FUNG|nr:RHO1 GDP-GTP exchange protein 2 [Entomophthora muscae]
MAQESRGSSLLGAIDPTNEGLGLPTPRKSSKNIFLRDSLARPESSAGSSSKFSNFNSKMRYYGSKSEDSSAKPKKAQRSQPVPSIIVNNSDLPPLPSPNEKKISHGTSPVSGEPNILQRSITVGSRSLSKMKAFSNFRSPETSPNNINSSADNQDSSEKINYATRPLPQLPPEPPHQFFYKKFLDSNTKASPKKLRNVRSEFFSNSSKTFSSMLPKMDKLNLFGKTPSIRGHKLSRSTTETITPTPVLAKAMTRSETDSELFSKSKPQKSLSPSPPDAKAILPLMYNQLSSESVPIYIEEIKEETTASQELFVCGALFSEVSYHLYKLLANQGQFDWPKIFSGREAVDLICTILGTDDRRLALLVGRALDSQKFISHVTLDLRLRDSSYETYKLDSQFETLDTLPEDELQDILPNGVFTLLTDCYSPTCSPEDHCYSISCPRRLETLTSDEPLSPEVAKSFPEVIKEELWENFVPPEVVASVTEKERKRQEIIFELIYTERDFVSDLKIIQELYYLPLLCNDIFGEDRDEIVEEIFSNIVEVHRASFKLSLGLQELQLLSPVVQDLGAFLVDNLPCFEPFKEYGANQVFSKRRLTREIKKSSELEEFLKNQARLPECRKLPIQSFLARPTTRLGRYPLLLEAILKYTEEGSSDIEDLPKAIDGIKRVLTEINVRTGIADNRVRIDDLISHLAGPADLIKELNLNAEDRVLVQDGTFKKKSGVDLIEIFVFLFDSHLLMAKKRKSTRNPENFEYKISKKPIKLDLLSLTDNEDLALSKPISNAQIPLVATDAHKSTSFPLTINHLGRQGGTYTLYCSTLSEKKRWKTVITEQQEKVLNSNMVFHTQHLADPKTCQVPGIFCSAVYDSGHTVFLGADDGIYAKPEGAKKFALALELDRVKKMEVLEDHDLLLVLSERTLYTVSLSAILQKNKDVQLVAEKLKSNIDLFSVGTCLGKALICAVKTTALSTTGRLYQPATNPRKSLSGPKSFLTSIGPRRPLEFFKEFYIPSESFNVYFLKSKLCVACAKGFEVLDLASLLPQGLLNPTDPNLEFVFSRGETVKPIAFFRIRDGVFFVCYDEFGFFVDRAGQLETSAPVIHWKGCPKSFTLFYPYILAFDPSFAEIRSLETGDLKQILHTNHTVTLRNDIDAIHLLDHAHLPDDWQLKELVLNRSHPSNISFRKNLKDARVSKRRGMIGSYSNS